MQISQEIKNQMMAILLISISVQKLKITKNKNRNVSILWTQSCRVLEQTNQIVVNDHKSSMHVLLLLQVFIACRLFSELNIEC